MAKHVKIQMSTESLADKSLEYFTKICGFDREGEMNRKMLQDALDFHSRIIDMYDIQAVVETFDTFDMDGSTLTVAGVPVACDAFEQIKRKDIERVFVYILTAGHAAVKEADGGSVLNMVYADAWGTAYVDAARDKLHATLAEGVPQCALSDSFGPGFYGMDSKEIENLFKLTDSGVIGVCLKNGVFMVPQKSCAGFYFAVNDAAKLPSAACRYCEGNKNGCVYCNVRK